MFSTERDRVRDRPRSWYGKPQHETDDDGSIEFERYGSPSHEQPREPVEFLPAVEWPVGVDGLPERRSTMERSRYDRRGRTTKPSPRGVRSGGSSR